MQGNSSSATNNVGYASKPVTKVPDWHALVAWDILFNNLSTGLFLVAAVCELVRPAIFTPVAKVAYPVALLFLMADLTCLVLDLGDPWRFHHMLRVFKPSSPMSFGTWCLTVYSLPLTVITALGFFSEDGSALDFVRRTVVVIGLLPALGSAVYKGVLISTNAQPGWKDVRWLGGYLTNSSLLLGCAEMLLLALVLGQESRRQATARGSGGAAGASSGPDAAVATKFVPHAITHLHAHESGASCGRHARRGTGRSAPSRARRGYSSAIAQRGDFDRPGQPGQPLCAHEDPRCAPSFACCCVNNPVDSRTALQARHADATFPSKSPSRPSPLLSESASSQDCKTGGKE